MIMTTLKELILSLPDLSLPKNSSSAICSYSCVFIMYVSKHYSQLLDESGIYLAKIGF